MTSPHFVGNRSELALEWTHTPTTDDPEQGTVAIWVQGECVTGHLLQGEAHEAVAWSLLPLARWMRANLRALVNEGSLPLLVPADDRELASATDWLRATSAVPKGLSERDEDDWIDTRQGWFERHSIRATRDGAVWPPLTIRRLGQELELSWDCTAFAPTRKGWSWTHPVGAANVGVTSAANVLDEFSRSVLETLGQREMSACGESIKDCEREPWLWLIAPHLREPVQRDDSLARRLRERTRHNTQDFIALHCPETQLLADIPPGASWLAVRLLLNHLEVADGGRRADTSVLDNLRRPSKAPSSRPWKMGYEEAERVLRTQSLPNKRVGVTWFRQELGIEFESIELPDQLDGACSWTNDHAPHVVRGSKSRFGDAFFLAKALGHFVMDAVPEHPNARATSLCEPWASGARAKAFAAMFLMPTEAVEIAFPRGSEITRQGVSQFASQQSASFQTAVLHLSHLRRITEAQRDALLLNAG
jgi:Zn-dependent peptidase ImmA (M78 family)